MTAKEKAQELIEKYSVHTWVNPIELMKERTKHCALIAVDEIITEIKLRHLSTDYWQEVKQEIEKL